MSRSGRVSLAAMRAVRALILYPMNALVEDQLQRLRKALDSDAVRTWLDTNRGGHRFFFGRYTGKTPVWDRREPVARAKTLARQLAVLDELAAG